MDSDGIISDVPFLNIVIKPSKVDEREEPKISADSFISYEIHGGIFFKEAVISLKP